MTARLLALSAVFAALVASGCERLDTTPAAYEKPVAEEKSNLPVAPAPRAKEDGLPPPPAEVALRPTRPWSELIVGKWLHVKREGLVGDKVREFTRGGKVVERYSYPAAPGHPAGIEVGTWEYRVNGTMLFAPSIHDDGTWSRESTTFIEALTENELVTLSLTRTRFSLETAKNEASWRKVPVEQVLSEFREERGRTFYVRLKDKDK